MKSLTSLLAAAFLVSSFSTLKTHAAVLGWSGSGSGPGSGANSAWLTAGNWTNLTLLPTTNDIVLFGVGGSATTIGINFNGIDPTNTYVSAIVLGVGSTGDRIIGNSSSTVGGTLNLAGVNGGVSNLVNGRTLTLAPFGGGNTFPMTLTLLSNVTFNATAGATNVVTAVIIGTGNLTNTGAGQLALVTSNTFTGKTILAGGSLLITNETGLGTNTGVFAADHLQFNGGTLRTTSNNVTLGNTNRGITMTGSGFLAPDSGFALTVNIPITGAGALTVNGSGTTVLSGANTHSGTLTVSGSGTTVLLATNAPSSATLINNAILRIASGTALGGSGGLTVNANNSENARLELSNNVTILSVSRTLTYGGRNVPTDGIRNISGNNIIAGPISFTTGGSNYAVDCTSGTLTLSGGVTSTATGARFLTLQGASSGTVSSAIVNGSATMGLYKGGIGTWTLNTVNPFSGSTLISGGTLLLSGSGSIASSPQILVAVDSTFHVGTVTGGYVLSPGQTLAGFGIVDGAVRVTNGAAIMPGTNFVAGTLQIVGNVSLLDGASLNVDLSSTASVDGGTNDLLLINGNLALSGVTRVNFGFLGAPAIGVPYTIARYSGTLTGGAANLVATNCPHTATFDTSVPGEVRVTFTGAANNLVWASAGGTAWDLLVSTNWLNGGLPTFFRQGDLATFNDSALTNLTVNLAQAITPGNLTVNSASNFIFQGAGLLAGGNLVKDGTGTLTVNTPNTTPGTITVQGGTLKAGNAAALGSAAGTTVVTGGGTLDVNAQNLGQEPVVASGAGVGGAGAIFNSGAQQLNALKFLTLAGDTTFGGTGRWDMRSQNGNAVLSSGGQPYKITKVGANLVALVDTVVDPALGDIDVQAGTFSTETFSQLGDPTKTITVWSNATFRFWNNTLAVSKTMVMSNSAKFFVENSTLNAYNGAITLVGGTNTFEVFPSSTLTVTGNISGAAALLKTNTGTLILYGTNSFTGPLIVSNGVAQGTTASIPGAVSNFTALQINQTFDGTLAGPIAGPAGLVKRGIGKVTITNPLSITGTLTNEAGTIVLGADNVLGFGTNDWRGAGGFFPAFESADASTRTITNYISISTDTRLGSAGSGDLVFSGIINNGAGVKSLNISNAVTTFTGGMTTTGPFNKFGPGQLSLGGNNNNTAVVISNGTVALIAGGAFTNFPNMTIASGAVLDYSAGAGTTFTNASGKTLIAGRTSGSGNDINGSLISTGTVTIAAVGVPATLTVNGNVAIGGGTLNFDLANVNTVGGGVNDLITNNGTLNLSGTITLALNLVNGALANGTYTLMQSAGALSSSATFTVTGTNGWRQNVSVVAGANALTLTVAGTPIAGSLTWLGTNVNWDLVTTNWWSGSITDRFFHADSVLFDNSSTNTNVVVSATLLPGPVTVNSSSNYAFSGAGKISGGASFTKSGTGTNLMSLANDYTGPTYINGGVFRLNAIGALGATNFVGADSATYIASGATLDVNANVTDPINENISVQGSGVNGQGAIVNLGAAGSNKGLRGQLTLLGDTTFGAANRWDIFARGIAGNGYNVTKLGTAEMFMNAFGDSGFGDVDVQQGFFTWGGNATPGDPTKTYTVRSGALLNFFAHTVPFSKMLTLQNGALVQNGSGTAILAGPVTLVGGSALFNNVNSVIVSNAISGPGMLVKQNSGTLVLLHTNTYTGGTFVSAGALTLGNGVFTPIVVGLFTNNATVDLNPAYAYPFTNYMAGSGTFTKSGTNSAQLAGNYGNDQLGDLLTLSFAGGAFDWNGRTETIRALSGSAGTAISNSAGGLATMILANPSANQTYSGSILGNIQVIARDSATKNTGVQTFAGVNTFTGGLIIDNGQVRVALDTSLGAVPSSFDADALVLRNGGLLQNNNTYLNLHPNRGVFLESGDGGFMAGFSKDIAVFGTISGPGRLVKADGGRLFLEAANTFTGDTVFNNIASVGTGILRLDHPLALQNSTFDATGIAGNGTLDLNFLDVVLGGLKGNGATIANFTGRLTVGNNNQSTTFGGVLSGAGSLVKIGSGVLDLTGANTYTGGTTVSNGTLNVAGSLASSVTVRNGASLGGLGTITGNVTGDPGATIYPGASIGTLTINGTAAFASSTLLFELSNLTTIGLGVNDFIQVNGPLVLNGSIPLRFGFVNGAPAAGTYTIIRYTGALTGSAANFNTSSSRYAATVDTSVAGEVRVTFSGSSSNLVWRGDGAGNAWDLNTTSNFFDGAGLSLFRDGDNVLFDNTGSNNVPVTLAGLLAPAAFTVNAAIDYTFAGLGELTTPAGLTKLGAGKLTLANTNDSFGPLNILGGTVAISADENLGLVPPLATVGRVVLNGGALQVNSSMTLHPNRGLLLGGSNAPGNGTIDVSSGNNLLYSGVIANTGGAGSLTKAGTGTLILGNANTYSGNTTVSKGRLLARNAAAFGTSGSIIFGDANTGADSQTVLLDTATNGASLTIARDIVVSSSGSGPATIGSTARFGFPGAEQAIFNGNITLNGRDLYLQTGAGDFTRFNGLITGTGNLFITNSSLTGDQRGNAGNRLMLENTPKNFTGDVTILAGGFTNYTVLQVGSGGNTYDFIPDGANVVVQTNAVLRLFAHEAINGLSGEGRVRGVVNQYVLTLGASNATSTFNGVMENDPFDAGSLAVTKIGTGNFTLGSVSPYSGPTILGGGTFTLGAGAAITNSASLTMSNGTTLDASALAGGLTLRNNQILSSFGTVSGGLTSFSNTTVNPGLNGVAGTLTVIGDLNLANATKLNIDLGSATTLGGGVNDLIAVAGDLNLSGVSPITVNAVGALAAGTYRIITYTGAKTGTAAANLTLVNTTGRSGITIDDSVSGEISLVVATAGGSLVWAANFTNSLWDVNTTTNWLNLGALDKFLQADAVSFDSTASNPAVTLNVTVTPALVSFTGTTNYTVSGSGKISGSASIVNNSSSTNTISTANDFNGPVTVQAGVLKAGNATALGTTVAGTFVASGATLDFNGQNLGAEAFTVSGSGVGGQGALINGGASQQNAARYVTLAGDTTVSAANRWDIRGATTAPATLSSGGNPYKLTKVGGNQFSLVNALVDPALGDIDVVGGTFSLEVGTTGLGDPVRTLAIGTNASLQFFNLQTPLNKNLILSNASAVVNNSGDNRILSPVTLVGSNIFNIGGTALTISSDIGGSGFLSKISGGSSLLLGGNNTYSGGTFVGSGTLMLGGNNGNAGGALVNGGTTLQLGTNGPGGTIAGIVTNNGTLNLLRTDAATHNFNLVGVGSTIHAAGSGPVTLSGIMTNANLLVRGGLAVPISLGAGSFTFTNLLVGHNTAASTSHGLLTVLPGASVGVPSSYFIGDGAAGNTGAVVQVGGDIVVTNQFRLAHWPTTVSTYLMGGGSLTMNTIPATTPAGGSEVNGGFYIGIDGVGIFTQTGGVVNVPGLVIDNRSSTVLGTATNTYELRGGTLNLGQWGILSPVSTYQINLGGGTVSSSLSWTSALNMALTGNGGNVNFAPGLGLNNQLGGVLYGSGGLTKSGGGTLYLANANSSFTGNIAINGGTVVAPTAFSGNNSTLGARNGTRSITIGTVSALSLTANNVFAGGGSSTSAIPAISVTLGSITSTRYNAIGNVTLNSSTLTQSATDGPGAYEGYQLLGSITVGGGPGASSILSGNGRANHLLGGGTNLFNVADATGSSAADLLVTNPIKDGSGDYPGVGTLQKTGAGTMVLAAANTYTGTTYINAGVLRVDGSIAGRAVADGGTLGGIGTVNGPVTIAAAGTIAPGASIGTLTVASAALSGTTLMEIDRGAAPNADLLASSGSITNGGALVVTNLGADLQEGDTFNLFDGTLVGTFASVTLPSLTGGLVWDLTALYTTGIIKVATPPSITTQPASVTNECGIGAANFTVVASGTSLTYQWRSNGVAVAGANSASFAVTPPRLAASGSAFEVVITNNIGSVTSSVATLTVVDTTAPTLVASNITRYLTGESVSIGVSEVFNSVASFDACSGTVLLLSALPNTFTCPGAYAVTVTAHDGNGNTNTAVATVTIVDPAATNLLAFEPFRCYTEGSLHQQSYTGTGFGLGGWTNDSGNVLVTNAASLAYASGYYVLATEGGRAFTPAAGFNTVIANMDTNTSGAFSTLVDGGRIGGPNASGTLYFSFLARNASGELTGDEDFAGLELFDDGTEVLGIGNNWGAWAYGLFGISGDVDLTNNAGGFFSMNANTHLFVARIDYASGGDDTVTVWMDPDIAASETGQGNLYRRTFTGNARFNRIALRSGSNNNDNSWEYDEIRFGTNWANVIPAGVAITTQPASVAQQCGGSTSLSVTAAGLVALEYQWFRNASAVSAATNASLNISAVTTNTAGSYTVVVSNRFGSVTSAVATVTVTNTPSLISPAGPLAVGTENNECGTMVLAGGSSYRWELNDATGGAGTGWDLLNVTGDIDIEATSGNPFTVNLWSLNGAVPGLAANWNNDTTSVFTIATASGAVNNFAANKLTLNDATFANDLAGGVFSIEEGSLKVRFTPNHTPVANASTNNRAPGLTLKIKITNLLATATSDVDGDERALIGLSASTNGATITTNATYIFYSSTNNLPEAISYTVRDLRSYRAGDTVRTAAGLLYFTAEAPSGTNANAVTISFTNGVVGMRFAGIPGYTYNVQRTEDLTPPATWTTLHTTNCPPLGLFDFIDTAPPMGAAYYRTAQP